MKKIIFTLLVALFLSTTFSMAQDKKWFIGPKVGWNVSSITSTDFSSWRNGVTAGVFMMYKCNSYIGFQHELLYTMMGANYYGSNIQLDYITMPMLGKIYLFDNMSLNMGPQIGVKVRDKIGLGNDLGFKDSHAFNAFELQFLIGLSYEFKCGLLADFRYGIGLTNSIKNSYNFDDNSKNQMFQLSMGWKF